MAAKKKPLRLEWLDPADLEENPSNWRLHPENQTAGLESVMAEVGWAGALLLNETTGRLIDGHARKKLPKDAMVDGRVPVLVGSWSEEQEKLILATLDPIAAMAEPDREALSKLVAGLVSLEEYEELSEFLEDIDADFGLLETSLPPLEFDEVDDSIETEHQCPKCGYEWSGKSAPSKPAGE